MRTSQRAFGPEIAIVVAVIASVVAAPDVGAAGRGGSEIILPSALRYEIVASKPRLNRKLLGPATRFVQGVPAEPIDSFVWNGDGSVEVEGTIRMALNPNSETGEIRARWSDRNGEWRYRQTRFVHPDYVSGVRIGGSVSRVDHVINQAILPNAYLHGDTTAGNPVLPTLFALVGTWGRADVELDGVPFENPFGLPGPQWDAHVMVTEGVRHPDGSVRDFFGGYYSPARAGDGIVEDGDLEVHLVFHDERFPMVPANFPPLFSFFYHLVFEDVSIRIVQADEPLFIDDSPALDAIRPVGRPALPSR